MVKIRIYLTELTIQFVHLCIRFADKTKIFTYEQYRNTPKTEKKKKKKKEKKAQAFGSKTITQFRKEAHAQCIRLYDE